MEEQPKFNFYEKKNVTVIKAPVSGGQGKRGVELGAEKILAFGLLKDLEDLGWNHEVVDALEGVDESSYDMNERVDNVKNPTLVSDSCKKVHDAVANAHAKNSFPLTIGGDHSIGMGTLTAFIAAHPNGGVIWVDAHADINTPSTTESGNLHGSPVAFAMGLESETWPAQFQWIKDLPTHLKPNKIAYIGLRDIDEGEKRILKEHNITAFSMYHVDKYGINEVVQRAIKAVNPTGTEPIHLSYDVDSIDPLFVPATGTPVRGGLTFREGLFIAEELSISGHLAGLDIVEVNPSLALHETHAIDTVSTGLAIIRCALGETLL